MHTDDHEHGTLAACVARDVAERRSLERQLIAKHRALYAAHAELEATARRLAHQVLSNLSDNAMLAMPEGGTLRVRASMC